MTACGFSMETLYSQILTRKSQEKDDTLTCSLLLDFQYNHLSVAPGPRSSYILLDAEIKANTSHFVSVMADIVASIIHTEK